MELTKEQKDILARFTCQRLSGAEENRALIRAFHLDRKGTSLEAYLHSRAWDEDQRGENAVYLVKYREDGSETEEAVMYFSIKCGGLFRVLDEEKLENKVQKREVLEQLRARLSSATGADRARQLMETVEMSWGGERFLEKAAMAEELLGGLRADRSKDNNKQLNRVFDTYPAVELVHFCVNGEFRRKWEAFGMPRLLGEAMFWQFVVPHMVRIREYVGCRYAYLFAADTSPDGRLVAYYDQALQFKKSEELGVTKPAYDFRCEFMCQDLNDIMERREEFFHQFDPQREGDILA